MRISDWSSDGCSSDPQLAPTHVDVPSGQRRRIDYAVGDDGRAAPPVLAVKLQELFGLADTPRIADGRVRSEERRGGKECVSTGRSRWSPYNEINTAKI